MKREFRIHVILFAIGLLHFACSDSSKNDAANGSASGKTTAGFTQSDIRIESEDRLTIPVEKTEEVWRFLYRTFVEDTEQMKSFDVSLQSSAGEELFTDTYFDTPEFDLHKTQAIVRHRLRQNIADPSDKKSGKERMQIKSDRLSSILRKSGLVKFKVAYHQKLKSLEDKHPAIGLVKRSKRDKFKSTLKNLDIDANALQPVLASRQHRRSIAIAYNNSPFMAIALDEVSSEKLWAKIEFTELVLELDETTYAEADAHTRQYMQDIAAKVRQSIRQQFPSIRRDRTSKYSKSFNALAAKIPMFEFLVRHGLI